MRDEESWLKSLLAQLDELNRQLTVFHVLASKFLPVIRKSYGMLDRFGKS